MKTVLGLALFVSFNASAGGYSYDCYCIRKNSHCENRERLQISVSPRSDQLDAQMTSQDDKHFENAAIFEAIYDSKYRNKTQTRFKITNSKNEDYDPAHSAFVIETEMLNGGREMEKCDKGGFAKAQYKDENSTTYSVNYVCCI